MFHLQLTRVLYFIGKRNGECGTMFSSVYCLAMFSLIQAGWLERIKVSEVVCDRKILSSKESFSVLLYIWLYSGSDRCT